MVTGSSWTTAGTLGVAFVGMAKVMGLSDEVEAGAVICGAYFGDKMIPLSETTILVPSLVGGGLTVGRHIRNMFWTAGPTLRISLVIFLLIGLNAEPHGEVSTDQAREILGNAFNITPLNLLPLILLVVFTVKRVPPFLAILGSALFAGSSSASRSGPRSRRSSTNPDWGRSRLDQGDLRLDGDRLRQQDGLSGIDQLFSRGGMASLLTTVWLVLAALSFAAILEHAGFLEQLLQPVVNKARSRGQLIASVNASGVGLNVVAGDQYVAVVLPSRMFRNEFERRRLAPQALSRAVEDSGTVTSVSGRGTRAVRTSRACLACRPLPTSRTVTSTS